MQAPVSRQGCSTSAQTRACEKKKERVQRGRENTPNWPVAETARDADLNYNRVPFHTSILPLFNGADCQSWVIEKAMQIYWRMWPALALERLDDMRGDLGKLGEKSKPWRNSEEIWRLYLLMQAFLHLT